MDLSDRLQQLVVAQLGRGQVQEAVLCVAREADLLCASAGFWAGVPVSVDTPYFVASTSKLLTTAMILRLRAEGRLSLDDPIVDHFPEGMLTGLHRWRGQDLTSRITLRHLLSHRSGLPDYFEGRRRDGSRLSDGLLAGRDMSYGLPEVLGWARDEMRPHFPPGEGRRALYADTNFYLLGEVIARVCGTSLAEALQRLITVPLGLNATRFFGPGVSAMPLRHGASVLEVPNAMACMPADGGVVSTARDMQMFTQAFFDGGLVPRGDMDEMQDWCRIFFPLQSGVGLLRFRLPRVFSPWRASPELLGHSGISGAFAFHCPEMNVTLTGTVNQISGRGRPFRLMLQALELVRRYG
ncbi:MAG: serine hydrolase domain-containing protein [Hydrogenophaga sp.]|nr:serine hydrolase domain-containing protein [Hydrogenophaga sp.]